MADHINQNALSYWFPLLEAAGLPVPKTIIVEMPTLLRETMMAAMNGELAENPVWPADFFEEIGRAADAVGWPCFLRSDHTSHKHRWSKTCHLTSRHHIRKHIFEIAEFSEMAGMFSDLSWNRWAVREMLPTIPAGYCPAFEGMPICKEYRFFVRDGEIECFHAYWPAAALEQGGAMFNSPADQRRFYAPPDNLDDLKSMARAAGRAVPGHWSIDILETLRGWMVTDMALAEDSFHWPDCRNSNALPSSQPKPPPEFNPRDLLTEGSDG